jgi:long-chain acyl-CoA synthetase
MISSLLYERWRAIVKDRRNEMALRETSSGQSWTFGELARATETPLGADKGVIFPQGNSAGFIMTVLRGWRSGVVVCPLEAGQCPPSVLEFPASCVHLKTTSATTGAPRLVAFSGDQLGADADNIVATMGLRPEWPNLGVISLAHSYGFSNLVLPLLLHGIPLILIPSPLPDAFSRAAAQEPEVTVAGVPVLWRAWHEARAISPNVRLAISAGAPLAAPLEQDVFSAAGVKIHNFYGASECGGIAYDGSLTPRSETSYVGTPLKNVQLCVARMGCLQIQSAAVAKTYWPNPDRTLENGIFLTSDLAEMKGDSVFLRGRVGDQINVAGRKVSAQAIERVLAECPQVRDCVVFAVPNDGAGLPERDRIVACVAVGGPLGPEELKQFAASRLPDWQMPRVWWFVDSIAANERGKIRRDYWKSEYLKTTAPR